MKSPKNTGLRARIRQWFLDNPDEQLTFDDMVTKFGATRRQVTCALWYLRAEGVIEDMKVYQRRPERTFA